jgi:protein-S-isoprenylcysteine O-methyltransferase Ste14
MRATEFEFRHRFWLIGAVFFSGFSLQFVDSTNVVVAAFSRLGVDPDSETRAIALRCIFAIGALLAIACGLVRTWAAAYLTSDVVHDSSVHSDRLVADGPYRHVRNPLYFALLLLAIAFALLATPLGALVIIAGNALIVARLIGREEAELERTQGESYAAYCRAVPRILPALSPRVPSGGRTPRYAQALRGELFIWSFAAGLTAFAATLDFTWMLTGVGVGYVAALFTAMRGQASSARSSE